MGQLLLVQGEDPERVRMLSRRACHLFRSLHGVTPSWASAEGPTAIARFQPLHENPGGSFREREIWAMSAGAWLHADAGRPGAGELALAELASAFAAGTGLHRAAGRFEGHFLLAAGRASASDGVVITDRLGILHAYHTTVDGCLAISTSASVLGALRGSSLDPEAARELLGTGSVFGQRSLFQGVAKLAAGSIYPIRNGRILGHERWFDLRSLLQDGSSPEATVPMLADALVETMQEIFRSYPRPLLDLTGGIDTRNLLAAARRLGLAFATVVSGPDEAADVVLANRIARELSLDHRQQVPDRDYHCSSFEALLRASASCDGECNVLEHVPVIAIQELTAKDFSASVNGTLGEVCHGNGWYLASRTKEGLDLRKAARMQYIQNPLADRMTRGRFADRLIDHFQEILIQDSQGLDHLPAAARADYLGNVQRCRWAGRIASSTLRIRPCLAPFMFERLLRVSLAIPSSLRVTGQAALGLIQHLDPRLASLPMMASIATRPHPLEGLRHGIASAALSPGGRFSAALMDLLYPTRRHVGLGTWDIWTLPEVSDLLRPDRMLTRDLYDEPFLRSFLILCRKRRHDPSSMLGRILSLEIAARRLQEMAT